MQLFHYVIMKHHRFISFVWHFTRDKSYHSLLTLDTQHIRYRDYQDRLDKRRYFNMTSAGLTTGQTGQLPRGLHKKGPPQKHIYFLNIWLYCTVYVIGAYLSAFASFILITHFILKSMDTICHAQNSNQSVKHR